MYALYIIFILGNIIMIPFGIMMIRLARALSSARRARR
jgi:putative tricarboxylic transport membrane protein